MSSVEDKHKASRETRDRKRDERRKAERERRENDRQKNRETESQSKNRDDRGTKKDRTDVDGKRDHDRGGNKGLRDQRGAKEETAAVAKKIENSNVASGTPTVVKEEKVKKYSESRRERFARTEAMKNNGKDTKTDKINEPKVAKADKTIVDEKVDVQGPSLKPSDQQCERDMLDTDNLVTEKTETAADTEDMQNEEENLTVDEQISSVNDDLLSLSIEKNMGERKLSIDDGRRSSSSGDGGGGNADKSDSQTRRIRNKDRPSLLIYQPGKRRLPITSIGKKDESVTTESPTEKLDSKLSPSTSSSTVSETVKFEESVNDDAAAAAKSLDSEGPKKIDDSKKSEKKVTRYSERRNRAKERRGSKGDRTNVEAKPTTDETVTEQIEKTGDPMPIEDKTAAANVESTVELSEIALSNESPFEAETQSEDKPQTVESDAAEN